MKFRLALFLGHLACSALVVMAAVAVIIGLWYWPPLHAVEGVVSILMIMALVDVVIGPLCTLVIASPAKPRPELRRDITFIGVLQLAALGYAVYSVAVVRPVFLTFAKDAVYVIPANSVLDEHLSRAAAPFNQRSWTGPQVAAAVSPDSEKERQDILLSAAVGGLDLQHMPQHYQKWPGAEYERMRRWTLPLDQLIRSGGVAEHDVRSVAARFTGGDVAALGGLKVYGRTEDAVAVIRRDTLELLRVVPALERLD